MLMTNASDTVRTTLGLRFIGRPTILRIKETPHLNPLPAQRGEEEEKS